MSNRTTASLGPMRYSKSADAIRHARGGYITEQHRRATGQARAFTCQIHWQPGGNKLAVASVATADREQSYFARLAAAYQQWHLQCHQYQAAFYLQFSTAFPQ